MTEQDLAPFGPDSYPEVAQVLAARRARAQSPAGSKNVIRLCVDRCAKAKDGRGTHQAERLCVRELVRAGGTPSIAADVAAAARRIGEWLREREA